VFSTEDKAKYAMENFIEGTLNMEFAGALNVQESIVQLKLDEPLLG